LHTREAKKNGNPKKLKHPREKAVWENQITAWSKNHSSFIGPKKSPRISPKRLLKEKWPIGEG